VTTIRRSLASCRRVADDLGATASQAAIAWTMAKSRAVHPILGARRLEQLTDNLGALDCVLPGEALDRLEAATGFDVGFPSDFIANNAAWVLGESAARSTAVRRQRGPASWTAARTDEFHHRPSSYQP